MDAWLPHLIVLHDLNICASYWARVTSDTVVGTGKGAKRVFSVKLADEIQEVSS